ncbi:MAG: hypothetical protein GYA24_16290 [Candidatus Lokiarchaeota archaeon]|nr:hypothetical protein [Candidatus Lokiarchaeota archaeon]
MPTTKWYDFFWCTPEEVFDLLSKVAAAKVTWFRIEVERFDPDNVDRVIEDGEFTFPTDTPHPDLSTDIDWRGIDAIHEARNTMQEDARVVSIEIA